MIFFLNCWSKWIEEFDLCRLYEQGLYSDVTFVVDERIFPLHRCVLAARSSFFQDAFETRWFQKRFINLTKAKVIGIWIQLKIQVSSVFIQFNADTFEAVVRYLYTNCCEISFENIDNVKALARTCRLPRLIESIEQKKLEIDEWRSFFSTQTLNRSFIDLFFLEASKTSTSNIFRLIIEPDENDDSIRLDFRLLAEQTIPIELRQWVRCFSRFC